MISTTRRGRAQLCPLPYHPSGTGGLASYCPIMHRRGYLLSIHDRSRQRVVALPKSCGFGRFAAGMLVVSSKVVLG